MNQLCSVCRKVDFGNLFRYPKRAGDKDTIAGLPYKWNKNDVILNTSCPFCRTLARGIELHKKEVSSRPKNKSARPSLVHLLMSEDEIRKWEAMFQDDSVIQVRQEAYMEIGREHASSSLIRLNLGFGSERLNWTCKYSIYNYAPAVTYNDEPTILGARVINPQNLDVDLARSWIEICIDSHSSCRWEKQTSTRSVRTRLIDTVHGCIIDAPDHCDYAALSYVWGEAAHHKLKLESSNCGRLQRQGYLAKNSHLLSRTVRDAIDLCQELDIRYLWVDSLCIMQDCADDKKRQIGAMGDIYKNAMITLVGAVGEDEDAGLSRVTTLSQSRTLDEEVDGIRMTVIRNDLEPLLNSTWNERGWTFQERILSRRLLIFTPSLMLFTCSEAIWREDIATESIPNTNVLFAPYSPEDQLRRKPAPSSGDDCLENYCSLLFQYLPRKLSHEEDRINAFSGVLSEFSPEMGNHIWGIPEYLLWVMLLWSTQRHLGHNQPMERNNIHDEHGNIIELFPSWTWAGWKFPSCGINIELKFPRSYNKDFENSMGTNLQIFILDGDRNFRALRTPEWKKLHEHWADLLEEHTPINAVDVITAQHGHRETSELERLLFFWTRCVRLPVDCHITKERQGYRIGHYSLDVLVFSKERWEELFDEIEFVQLNADLWAPVYSIGGISYRLEPTVCSIPEDEIPSYVRLVALG